jgi:Tfp pilus assembly protein PilO
MGGRRGPLIAGGAVAAVLLLVLLFLVLPKMRSVTDAQARRDQAEIEQTTLLVRKEALEDAKANAGAARATITEVHNAIPELADEPGILLLLHHAAEDAGLDVASFGVGEPTFDGETGLSVITVTVAAEGSYFEVADFLYGIETLPRAAKVTGMTLSPTDTTGTVPILSLSASIELFTTDSSAGTGSIPGPQPATGGGG